MRHQTLAQLIEEHDTLLQEREMIPTWTKSKMERERNRRLRAAMTKKICSLNTRIVKRENVATADRLFAAIAKVDAAGNRRKPSEEFVRYIGSPEWKAKHGYDQPKVKKDERKATWAFIAKNILKEK